MKKLIFSALIMCAIEASVYAQTIELLEMEQIDIPLITDVNEYNSMIEQFRQKVKWVEASPADIFINLYRVVYGELSDLKPNPNLKYKQALYPLMKRGCVYFVSFTYDGTKYKALVMRSMEYLESRKHDLVVIRVFYETNAGAAGKVAEPTSEEPKKLTRETKISKMLLKNAREALASMPKNHFPNGQFPLEVFNDRFFKKVDGVKYIDMDGAKYVMWFNYTYKEKNYFLVFTYDDNNHGEIESCRESY